MLRDYRRILLGGGGGERLRDGWGRVSRSLLRVLDAEGERREVRKEGLVNIECEGVNTRRLHDEPHLGKRKIFCVIHEGVEIDFRRVAVVYFSMMP